MARRSTERRANFFATTPEGGRAFCAQWIAQVADFLGIRAHAGAAKWRFTD
jgi:hypothetical protein